MKLLFTIPHFFKSTPDGRHGSLKDPRPRIAALTTSVSALHHLYGNAQRTIQIRDRTAIPANQDSSHEIDVTICTTQDCHLLDRLPLPKDFYQHHPTEAEPMLLGFECQAVLKERLGQYDYYCFLEDDLILHDPWFFAKLQWFNRHVGDENLLQPNRYELSNQGTVRKAYIDGDINPRATENFQNIQEKSEFQGRVMDTPVTFRRPLNPHSGCYFLNANQMSYWVQQEHFLDRNTSFIGPLESAATLGIMKTFRIYKPALEQSNFLEIQHHGSGFISLIGGKVKLV